MNDSAFSRVSPETWKQIKEAYQKGEGSCRELAQKFGLTHDQVRNKCHREKWASKKSEIQEKLEAKVAQKVTQEAEKLVESLASDQRKHVDDTLKRAARLRASIDAAIESFPTDPNGRSLIDPEFIETLTRSEQRLDDMLRLSLGLPEKNGPSNDVNVSVGVGVQLTPAQLDELDQARKRWMQKRQGGMSA
jgi:transposase-like protein